MLCSFVIGFHSRRIDNLLQTLRFLDKFHRDVIKESQLILVCQDSCRLLSSEFGKTEQHNLRLKHMHLPYVTNFGVNKAVSDKLIILESDRILPKGYFQSVIDQMQPGYVISCKDTVRPQTDISDQEIEEKMDKIQLIRSCPDILGVSVKLEGRSRKNEIGRRNMWSGNTALMKSDYEKAGGMDEAYKGYGWADNDMTNAMAKIGVESIFREEIEIHLWHELANYGLIDESHMFMDNGFYYCKKWKIPVPVWLANQKAKQRKLMI